MATKAQINANRENAERSTGPRTPEGKRVVSQNAVKHGLFAHEAVVNGEDPAEFELHRNAFMSELYPVGVMESMLAERIVSLSWRLQRAERMQNQATDCLIEEDHLPLGRMVTKQWSNNLKIIEKLFMHERRIESSMNRTINKLKKLQIMRRIEREDAEEKLVAKTTAAENNNIAFVKQSQFAPDRMRATLSIRKDYEDKPLAEVQENKTNQSQFHKPASGKGMGKRACRKVPCG